MKITIVGGGTAGLITALIFNERLNADIEMIVPSNIGIIGVGEGSTEHWSRFLKHIGVSKTKSLVRTKGTITLGVNFQGWTPNTGNYVHHINDSYDEKIGDTTYILNKVMAENLSAEDIAGPELNKNYVYPGHEAGGTNQFHFNTFALNDFLTELAIKNNIKITVIKIFFIRKVNYIFFLELKIHYYL